MKILIPALLTAATLYVTPALSADPVRGDKLFQNWCASCHSPDRRENGEYLPGTESLQRNYNGSKPAALEQRDDLTVAYVELVIRRGTRAMPLFRKTEISDQEMHDIAAYLAKGKGAPQAATHSFLEPYFGNTFISHHSDGVEYRMLYSPDGHFRLVKSGAANPSANYELSGTYTVEGDQVCFQPPPDAFKCVPQDQGHKAGETWQVTMPDGGHATHTIVSGIAPRGPVVN